MASHSACFKLNNLSPLPLSRFHFSSPSRPAAAASTPAACKSRIKFTTRMRIKPIHLTAILLHKKLRASSVSVNDNEQVQKLDFPENHVSLNLVVVVVVSSLIMFMYNPPSAFALSASSIDLALYIAKPLITLCSGAVGVMALVSFEHKAIKPLLIVYAIVVNTLPCVFATIALIWRSHEFISTVIKLQVGLSGSGSSRIQTNLKQIANVSITSSPKGLRYVLAETALNLLQNIDFCNSGYSSVDVKLNFDDWKKKFKLLSVEERCKFDEETLVNIKNYWTSSSSNTRSSNFGDENIVVTILIAVKGVHALPSINGTSYLKEALQKMAAILAKETLAVEVYCTRQNENDMKWEQKLMKDFPSLRPL